MQINQHLSFETLYSGSIKVFGVSILTEHAFSCLLEVDTYIFDFHHFPVANRFVAINKMTPTN